MPIERIILAAILGVCISACGYDGSYRYECQDPENWENPDCYPPVCLVDGMCTENLIGFDPREGIPTTTTIEPEIATVETTVAP